MCAREREKGGSDDSITITHHIAVQYSTVHSPWAKKTTTTIIMAGMVTIT